jgi:hypothetical protein
MERSGQLYARAALLQRKARAISIEEEAGWASESVWIILRKKSIILLGIEP